VVAVASRRLFVLLVVLTAVAVPAGALRAACAGRSCADEQAAARVPFCPLPSWIKDDIAAGYREGRSPDVLAVAERSGLSAGPGTPPWPSVADGPDATSVPIVFAGYGVRRGAPVAPGTRLDAIAPTIAEALSFRRPHPDVRSGVEVAGAADGARPRLVVEIALEGIGTREVEADPAAWPELHRLLREGAGTLAGDAGSLPLDPTATLTTIGTGGPPAEHGITGSLLRNDAGRVVRAWGDGSPPSVIATLADDLDAPAPFGRFDQAPRIGLVAPSTADRGLVGGTWYPSADRDDVAILRDPAEDPVGAVERILDRGYGGDAVPDVLGVVLDGANPHADARLGQVVRAASAAAGGAAMIVVAGTGSASASAGGLDETLRTVEDAVPGDARVVSGTVAGGLFLDQRVLADERISGQAVVDALLGADDVRGGPLVRDAFQGFAVSFARYC
jgi:hypothetical protein